MNVIVLCWNYRGRRYAVENPLFLPFCLWLSGNQTITAAGYPVPKITVDAQHYPNSIHDLISVLQVSM